MKKIYALIICCLALSSKGDYWTQKASFGGGVRYAAVGFAIGSKGYIGTGYGGQYFREFWEYDPVTNHWSQKTDCGGTPRYFATGLSIGTKGYIGLGLNPMMEDFWEYDPVSDSWTQKADFGGGLRGFSPSAFSVSGKGYVGFGNDGAIDKSDLWEYDPALNVWTQKSSLPASPRELASAFSLNGKGYVGIGDVNSVYLQDFWEYDPVIDTWTAKTDFPGAARFASAAFALNEKGYLGTGFVDSVPWATTDFWQYDPIGDNWTRKTDFAGIARSHGVGFSIGNKGYIGTGLISGGHADDFWEYTADSTTSVREFAAAGKCSIFPNPTSDVVNVHVLNNQCKRILVFNADGKTVYESAGNKDKIDCRNFQSGIYFIQIQTEKENTTQKLIINH
jgi:N-acetylneuraminic acid mutarotase